MEGLYMSNILCSFLKGKRICKKHLEQSYAFATAYTPKLGYETVAKIIKENPPEKAKEILICEAAKQTNS